MNRPGEGSGGWCEEWQHCYLGGSSGPYELHCALWDWSSSTSEEPPVDCGGEVSYTSKTAFPNTFIQGACPDCYAIATVGVITDRFARITGNNLQLSPEYATACRGIGCKPGSPQELWGWLRDNSNTALQPLGCFEKEAKITQNCTPSKDKQGSGCLQQCPSSCDDGSPFSNAHIQLQEWTSYNSARGHVWTAQSAVCSDGPLIAMFTVRPTFLDFWKGKSSSLYNVTSDGVYFQEDTSSHNPSPGNHAVRITGWGVSSGCDCDVDCHGKCIPYWLVANSWGQSPMHPDGTFKIARGINLASIESTALGAGKISVSNLNVTVGVQYPGTSMGTTNKKNPVRVGSWVHQTADSFLFFSKLLAQAILSQASLLKLLDVSTLMAAGIHLRASFLVNHHNTTRKASAFVFCDINGPGCSVEGEINFLQNHEAEGNL
jgi:hypothetical protein